MCVCACTIPALPTLVPKGGWMRALVGYLVVLLCTPNWQTQEGKQGQISPITWGDMR